MKLSGVLLSICSSVCLSVCLSVRPVIRCPVIRLLHVAVAGLLLGAQQAGDISR